jgi:PAS domain S-box-containing protein
MTSAELGVVLDRLSDGVAVLDTDWSIGYANPAAARLLGRPGEELAGRNLWMALPELAGTALHAFLLHARSTGGSARWQGFYAPAGRWLTLTADLAGDDRLQDSLRGSDGHLPGPAGRIGLRAG